MGKKRVWTPAQEAGQVTFGFWPCRRPLTKHWGSDSVFGRIEQQFGCPDVAFGKTDGIPDEVLAVDLNTGFDWNLLPFVENHFAFGYWDPPYDKLYRPEAREIWRTCRRLAILHTHIYPRAWFNGATREAMVAVTMGPLKRVRCLQIFRKAV
jgi:hypothetical protein